MLIPQDKYEMPEPSRAGKAAVTLAEHVRENHGKRRAQNIGTWTRYFEALFDLYPAEQVEETLDWYVRRKPGPGCPVAFSARGFLTKYREIRKAMEDDPAGTAKVSDEGQFVLDSLAHLSWPGGVDQHLPRIVERSLINYKAFRNRVLGWRAALPGVLLTVDERNSRRLRQLGCLVDHLVEAQELDGPCSFVTTWLQRLHNVVARWKDWSGNVSMLTFTEDSVWLRKWGRQWSQDYFESSVYWDELIKEVSNGRAIQDDERSALRRSGGAGGH